MNEEYNQVLAIINRLDEDVVRGEEENKKIAEEICNLFGTSNISEAISHPENGRRAQRISAATPSGNVQNRLYEAVRDSYSYYSGFNTPTTTAQPYFTTYTEDGISGTGSVTTSNMNGVTYNTPVYSVGAAPLPTSTTTARVSMANFLLDHW